MARTGLLAQCCAGLLFFCLFVTASAQGEQPDNPLTATLAVQTALQHGRDHLLRGNAQAAVYELESQLARINGNREYLATLRDAYRALVKDLRLAHKDADAQVYLNRLQILDPGAALEAGFVHGANAPALPVAAAPKAPATEAPVPKVRAKSEDPFHADNARQPDAKTILARAEQEFADQRYPNAGRLFDQAHQADQSATARCQDRWGYCKLYQVVESLNRTPAGEQAYRQLEQDVRQAMSLAPCLQSFGTDLLTKIQERRNGTAGAPSKEAAPTVAIRHLDQTHDGWSVAETANFRIHHHQARDLAEQAAQVAERTRADMYRKWFGAVDPEWNPKCDLYLHATGQDYSKVTGVPANSPGHSTMRSDASRVLTRRIDLHSDEPNMLVAVLPHEATHVVLAGKFGEQPVPRWADEGMAVLTEPRDKIDRHLRMLSQHKQDRLLFTTRQLMQLNDYPDPRYIGSFYAQSVSLVEFLTNEKGPQVFANFLRDGMRTGYEQALKRHYNFQNFNELEQKWNRYAFRDTATPTGIAERAR